MYKEYIQLYWDCMYLLIITYTWYYNIMYCLKIILKYLKRVLASTCFKHLRNANQSIIEENDSQTGFKELTPISFSLTTPKII